MSLSTILIGYAVGFVIVIALTWLGLRNEPTAHGHIVGQQMGCLLALFWPLALVWVAMIGVGYVFVKAGRLITGWRA